MIFPLELKLFRNLWSVDVVHGRGRGCAGLLGEKPTVLFSGTLGRCRGLGLGVSNLHHCWCRVAY